MYVRWLKRKAVPLAQREQNEFFFCIMLTSILLLGFFSSFWSIWGCVCLFVKENWTRRGDLSWQLVTGLRREEQLGAEAACAWISWDCWVPSVLSLDFSSPCECLDAWKLKTLPQEDVTSVTKLMLVLALGSVSCDPGCHWTCWETNGLREIVTGNLEDVSPKPAWDIFLYLCQYFLKLGQYFSVCSFILALSRSFKRGLNMVPDDSY